MGPLQWLRGRIRLRRQRTLIASSGLFDAKWYLEANPDVAAAGGDPLAHFILRGAAEGRDPNPLFDTKWYLEANPDVAAAGGDPLAHFILRGASEGRNPNPWFETKWYLAANPDIAPGLNPLTHYIRNGTAEGRNPNPFFDIKWYLAAYPDVAAAGIDPLAHYIRRGAVEGRSPNPQFDGADGIAHANMLPLLAEGLHRLAQNSPDNLETLLDRVQGAAMFDDTFYREHHAQRLAGVPPLIHFLLIGEAEGAKPYATYAPDRVRATLRTRGLSPDGNAFLSFVDAQLAALRAQMERDRNAGRRTWVSPLGMRFVLDGGEVKDVLDASASPSDRPALRWPINQGSAAEFVVPIVAPGNAVRSLIISTEGNAAPGAPITLSVSKDLAQPPIATRAGSLESPGVQWDLSGIPLEKGRRYFLHIGAAGPIGLEIAVRAFHPVPQVRQSDVVHAAIVAVMYRSAPHIEAFLDAIYHQDYAGPITVVIVDDCSGDLFAELENRIGRMPAARPRNVAIQVVRNTENLGNCLSRNAGIAACDADIYVIIDADCLINRTFISAHIAEHRLPDTDAVVGPCIEGDGEHGLAMLRRLAHDRRQIVARATMQDELLETAFVNTVTGNFSVKKRWLDTHGNFDPMLSCSRTADAGCGWEDVDIGARIYAAKGTVRCTPHAFSIRLSHDSSLAVAARARGSAKNFHHLVNKHPFIRKAARRWYVDTADRIVSRADEIGETSPEIEALRADIGGARQHIAPLIPYLRKRKPRYRILTHRWHVPHQYEIHKLPFDFTLLTGTGTGFTNDWGHEQRPLRPNVRMVPAEPVDQSQFDMAIVHFDENVLCPDLGNGVLSTDWGDTFRWFLENIRLPMVAVCHGTVPFVGQYAANPEAIGRFELYQADAEELRRALARVNVVVNSHQAAEEWGFHRSHVIWHGLDPQEFNDGSHELDIIHHGVDLHRPHYRGADALREALAILQSDRGLTISTHRHAPELPVARSDPRFADFAFKGWLRHLGRHKVYLNTTLRSPMPRSRTEAMLCGVIPVTLDNHDAARFIENGVNGFRSSSVEELAEFCKSVCRDERLRRKMSAAARETAMDAFNHDRFLTEWVKLVEQTVGVDGSVSRDVTGACDASARRW